MNSTKDYTLQFVQTGIELPFVAFHVSVTACILREMLRKNCKFRGGFFKLYVAQSCSDIAAYVSYQVSLRFIDLLPEFMRRNPVYCTLMASDQGFECLTYALHVAIAANRYIVIARPQFRDKFTKLRATILCVVPPSLMGLSALLEPDCVSAADKEECIRIVYTLAFLSFVVYSGVTSAATIVLDVSTVRAFRSLNSTRQMKGQEDFRLLVYSMLQFTFIFAQCVMYGVITIGIWVRDGELVDGTFPFTWLNMSFIALSPPVCLIIMR